MVGLLLGVGKDRLGIRSKLGRINTSGKSAAAVSVSEESVDSIVDRPPSSYRKDMRWVLQDPEFSQLDVEALSATDGSWSSFVIHPLVCTPQS